MPSLEVYDTAVLMASKAVELIKNEQYWIGEDAYFGFRTKDDILVGLSSSTVGLPSCFCAVGALCESSGVPRENMLQFYLEEMIEVDDLTVVEEAFALVLNTASIAGVRGLTEQEMTIFTNSTRNTRYPLFHESGSGALQTVNDYIGHDAVVRVLHTTIAALRVERLAQAASEAQVLQERVHAFA